MATNPRPRKYASAAERQAAYRARFVMIEARLDATTADTLTRLAQSFDIPRAELLVQVIKQGLLARNWTQLGPRSDLRSGAVQQGARAVPKTRQEAPSDEDEG
jgi:hypothetical protein